MATCWACREWQCMYSRKVIFDESVCKAGSLTPLVVLVQSMRIMGRGRAVGLAFRPPPEVLSGVTLRFSPKKTH